MRTEDLVRGPRVAGSRDVSPALRERVPSDWLMTDARGRPAPLGTGGYLLTFGYLDRHHVYQLRVAAAVPGGPLPDVRLTSVPVFMRPVPGPGTATRHGREYRCFSFLVKAPLGKLDIFRRHLAMFSADLEFECETAGEKVALSCPLVARMRWTAGVVFVVLLGALFGWCLGQAQSVGASWWQGGTWPWLASSTWWTELHGQPWVWLFTAAGAVLGLLMGRYNHYYHLTDLTRQLEARYHHRFDPPDERPAE